MDKQPHSAGNGKVYFSKTKRLHKVNLQIWVVLTMTLLIFIGMSATIPYYASWINIEIMLGNYVMEGIMALGMTLVIISGGIDLSISGLMPFSAIVFAYMMKAGTAWQLSMLVVLLFAALVGFLNDLMIKRLKVHPFAVTLAMQLILKGTNVIITSGDVVSGFPKEFTRAIFKDYFGLSIPVIVLLVLAIFYLIMLRKNRYFRNVYFVGGNTAAAELSGINTKHYFRFIYMQSSILAGIAGIMACFIYGSANASYGINIETRVITAVAIGGTSMIHGGFGSIGGTLLGWIFVATIYGSFIMSGVSTYYQDVVTGVLLVFAVVFSERLKGIQIKGRKKR